MDLTKSGNEREGKGTKKKESLPPEFKPTALDHNAHNTARSCSRTTHPARRTARSLCLSLTHTRTQTHTHTHTHTHTLQTHKPETRARTWPTPTSSTHRLANTFHLEAASIGDRVTAVARPALPLTRSRQRRSATKRHPPPANSARPNEGEAESESARATE